MACFVLVHEAFMGGWAFSQTARHLAGLGHEVHVSTLSGCGERSHLLRPEIGLAWHVEDVCQKIFHEDLSQVVLAGHGYGALVACGAAHRMPSKAAAVIHLDGLLPVRGKSYADLAGLRFARDLALQATQGWLIQPKSPQSYGITCEGLKRWLSARLTPFPIKALTDPYPYGPRDRDLPGAYLRLCGPQNPLAERMAGQAKLMGLARHDLEAGPFPMLTGPNKLAQALHRIAAELQPGQVAINP
jgi:pimeloyl-ACP methyl ester carboxylesterase